MRVLNFGSLNIDYVYGVEHFVRKGETISSKSLQVYEGGKGLNQSIALSRAGAKVFHAGMIGTDGTWLDKLLKESGVDTRFIRISDTVRTGNAIIQNDSQGDNCIILYGGANQAILREMIDSVIDSFKEGEYLVLQNEINEIPYIVEKAHERGMKIVLNPSPLNEKIFQINLDYIDCFILNEVEAAGLLSELSDEMSDEKMTEKTSETNILLDFMQRRFPQAEIILTLGEKGSLYVGKEGIKSQKAYQVKAVDTTAAGDTFTGYYLAGRIEGKPVQEALDLASRASALAVTKKGAAPSIPLLSDVLSFK